MPAPATSNDAPPTGVGGLPRTFWGLWSAMLVGRVASFAQPFLALYLTQGRGVSAATAGAIVSGLGVGSVVAIVTGGWAADRFGRRVTMLTAQILAAGALLWLATAHDLWELWVSAVLVGVGGDLARPAMSATVGDLVPHRLQVRAFALLFWAINLGVVVATVSAGQLTRWGYPTLFVIEAAGSVVAGLIILRGVPESRPTTTHPAAPFWSHLRRDMGTFALVGVGMAYSIVYFQAYSSLPVVMAGQGIDAAGYGLLIGLNGVVICLLQPLLLRWIERFDPRHVYASGMVVLGAGFAATTLATTAWQHALVIGVWTFGEIAVSAVAAAMFSRRAPEGLTGRYMSLFSLTFAVGGAAGPGLGGLVLDMWGATTLWVGCGLAALAGATLLRCVGDAPSPGRGLSSPAAPGTTVGPVDDTNG